MKKTTCWKCGAEVPKINYRIYEGIPLCPKCGCKYPEKPKTEAKLSILQDNYLKSRLPKVVVNGKEEDNPKSKKDLDKLFYTLHDLTFNIICSKLKGSAMSLDKEDIEDKVQWSLIKMLSYYKEKPNFTGYISMVVLYPLYNRKVKLKGRKEVSINAPLDRNSENSQTLLDKLSLQEDDTINIEKGLGKYQSELVTKQIINFIKTTLVKTFNIRESEHRGDSFTDTLQLLICYKHFVNKRNDRFFTELWKTSSLELQDIFRGSLTILEESLVGGCS